MVEKTGDCLGPNCPSHCCKVYSITSAPVLANNEKLATIRLFEEEMLRLKSGGFDDYYYEENGGYFLALNEDTSCKAYEKGLCVINDAKPDVCRIFPYYFDVQKGLCINSKCSGSFKLEPEKEMEIYNLLIRRIQMFRDDNKN